MTRPGLTYWRCPECGTAYGWTPDRMPGWAVMGVPIEKAPRTNLDDAERLVEAHEARHGIGAA